TRPSRTLGMTMLTFVIVGLLMVAIYGKYDIGRRKNKPIIYSPASSKYQVKGRRKTRHPFTHQPPP
ncbi:MAG: hypothetical protein IIU52_00165, partial [Bacteroidaceae bacterium]|nr:hypothetical protein [Bacteroidaceae bacterium]